jgi:hypothetical protein
MPDAIAAPLLMIAFWSAIVSTSSLERVRRVSGVLGAGLLLGAEVLLRTSSQVYVPLPWLLGTERTPLRQKIGWTLLFVVGVLAPLSPWMMQNYEKHGAFAPAASMGRNFYFNAAYSGTLDRGKELAKYGIKQPNVPHSAYELADRALQAQIAAGKSIVEADKNLGHIALEAYKSGDPMTLARQRLAIAWGLFVPSSEAGPETLTPLKQHRDWYLSNLSSTSQVREMLQQRFRYTFSDEFVQTAAKRPPPAPWARELYVKWIDFLSLDGGLLISLYLLGAAVILLRSRVRRRLFVALVLPPALFIVVFSFVQAPLYRYQVGLHPFMLATIVAACASFATPKRKRVLLPNDMKMRRRLDG